MSQAEVLLSANEKLVTIANQHQHSWGESDNNFLLERIRRKRGEIYPVAIGIINIWKSGDRLLPTARTIGHVMGMQTEFSFLVHQL